MTTFLNLGSLALGLLAWALAIAALRRRRFGVLNLASLLSGALALLLQLMEVKHLALGLEDFSAIMDTISAAVLAGCLLLAVTAALNLAALLHAKRSAYEKAA